ncbi:MAG: UDP-N-acetylmuramoyl-L-alanine--D-glutamate ligase [Candidatus Tantalella remota]|nr:UDP-N-acetylmuramoyl-L-alanine--D-glutamate ligase [Candidatus Tantalella remota]
MPDIKGKTILVAGLGVSGQSAAELLLREGANVRVTDAADNKELRGRAEKLIRQGAEVELGGHTGEFVAGVDLVVTSPGIDPGALPLSSASEKGIPVIGEMELGSLYCRAPIVAVTGTNGKSTTTRLIGNIFSAAGKHTVVCGNIGNPLSGEIENIDEDSIVVLEVSSFQLETIDQFRPRVAILLNVAEDHYERHGDLERYRAEKFRIFENQTEKDWAILYSGLKDDSLAAKIKSGKKFFSYEGGDASVSDDAIILAGENGPTAVMKISEIPIKGIHNLENAACSVLAADLMGVEYDAIIEGITSFEGLRHRFEKVRDIGGVEFIDDSKATNIDATRRALESIDKKVVLIAGGRDKGGDYLSVLPLVKSKVETMVVIGEAADKMREVFSPEVKVVEKETLEEAVTEAASIAQKGEAVVLSPMCSSFDMFRNYKERGEVFQRAVKALAGQGK